MWNSFQGVWVPALTNVIAVLVACGYENYFILPHSSDDMLKYVKLLPFLLIY